MISDFTFLAAVPKQLKIDIAPPSSTLLSPGAVITQQMRINNPNKVGLKMKVKIQYKLDGVAVNKDCMVNNFPTEAWQ